MWMRYYSFFLLFLSIVGLPRYAAADSCVPHNLDFIMIEGDTNLLALEDDIRTQVALLGFNVTPRMLSKEAFNEAHVNGDFHLSFTETWGAPYDPHSYVSGWIAADEGHYQAMSNLEGPATRDSLFLDIENVLQEESHAERVTQWESILRTVHEQAIMLPLWGKRIPTVLSSRLTGYEAGLQQFDYPVHKLRILSGNSTVTIAPGAQTGLFESVGPLEPHSYRPNEFFSSNWVYEGLVTYGPEGQILPSLASNWSIIDNNEGGQTYTFTLRSGVTFHDNMPWNCEAAKLNFDHVLADPLRSADYHGWYTVPKVISSWFCNGDMEFVLNTNEKSYVFLQELTFIRPLRMLSPSSFVGTADPITENSCPEKWGNVSTADNSTTVTCVGIQNVSGTGPFVFASFEPFSDNKVNFERNENYWDGVPEIEKLSIVYYNESSDVKSALLDGSLDIVWGAGVLSALDLLELQQVEQRLSVYHSGDIQNSLLLLNSGKAPFDDIKVRKTFIHAMNKKIIIDKELSGFERPVSNIFPLDAPYCDVILTPQWDFDMEKARLLNCVDDMDSDTSSSNGAPSKRLARGLGLGLGALCLVFFLFIISLYNRSREAEKELENLRRENKAVDA